MANDDDAPAKPTRGRRTALVCGLLIAGGVAGLAAAGGVATVVAYTSTNDFCITCHEMAWPDESYQEGVHFTNASGVRADCASCHLTEHPWWRYLYEKGMAGTRDVTAHVLGTLDSRDVYAARRLELARRVWTHLEETDSRWCRNCHSGDAMQLDAQSPAAGAAHRLALDRGITCIECHRGIGHGVRPQQAAEGSTGRSQAQRENRAAWSG